MKDEKKPLILRFNEFKKKRPRFVMSALLFFVVPLFLGFLMCYEMKADVAISVPTVIVNHDNSDFSRTYAKYIEESGYFDVIEYADNDKRVEEMIYKGEAHAGVIIPENFYSEMLKGEAPVILNVYDGSGLAMIVSSRTTLSEILLTVKSAYMKSIFEGKQSSVPDIAINQAAPINMVTKFMYSPTKSIRNFLLPGMVCALVQISMAIAGAESGFANRWKRLGFGSHLRSVIRWSIPGILAIFLIVAMETMVFGLPIRGSIPAFILMTAMFSMCITMQGYIFGSVTQDRIFGIQLACVTVLPTPILGGYTWPVMAMPAAFQHFSALIPFTYYGNGIRSFFLKPVEFRHLGSEFLFFTIFLVAATAILYVVVKVVNRRAERRERAEADKIAGGSKEASAL